MSTGNRSKLILDVEDLTGVRRGRLTVEGPASITWLCRPGSRKSPTAREDEGSDNDTVATIPEVSWWCRCDCGRRIRLGGWHFTQATRRKTCGKTCVLGNCQATHGATKKGQKRTEYSIWAGIKARCFNPNDPGYHKYGAKGISMDPRWVASFVAFLDDIGPRPSLEHSVDRYPDKAGNYEPGNVRWATRIEQARNRSNVHQLTWNGVTRSLPEWAEVTGVRYALIRKRFYAGWPPDRIFGEPSAYVPRRPKPDVAPE